MVRLEHALAQAKAGTLRREGTAVHFQGGMLRTLSNWNVLVPISDGVLDVSPSADGVSVAYRVTFTQLLVVITLMVGAFFGPAVMAAPNASAAGGLSKLAISWLWLFGGNFVLTRWRLPAFLIRSLTGPEA